jgi:Cu-processing system permease protein
MTPLAVVRLVARKEVRDALRSRWFQLYAAGFAFLALALSRLSLGEAAGGGLAGFGRTAASLVNLVLLTVPLMGLTLGAGSLAGERERGTLATLLAQPVTRAEVLAGKYLGLSLALGAALTGGFGLAAVFIAAGGGAAAGAYGLLLGLALLLALAMLALGLMISAVARRTTTATGAALFVWLGLVFLGDLGLMGTALTMRLPVATLLLLAVLNPIEAYRIAAIQAITGGVDVLGPAGAYAARTLGAALLPALAGMLLLWILVPLGAARWIFDRRGIV